MLMFSSIRSILFQNMTTSTHHPVTERLTESHCYQMLNITLEQQLNSLGVYLVSDLDTYLKIDCEKLKMQIFYISRQYTKILMFSC